MPYERPETFRGLANLYFGMGRCDNSILADRTSIFGNLRNFFWSVRTTDLGRSSISYSTFLYILVVVNYYRGKMPTLEGLSEGACISDGCYALIRQSKSFFLCFYLTNEVPMEALSKLTSLYPVLEVIGTILYQC